MIFAEELSAKEREELLKELYGIVKTDLHKSDEDIEVISENLNSHADAIGTQCAKLFSNSKHGKSLARKFLELQFTKAESAMEICFDGGMKSEH